jgi:dolichol-phosphate mannosyltransferase
MKSAVAVIATFNEAANIRSLVEKLLSVASDIHLLVVDDNSPDGTGRIVDELARNSDSIHVIHRAKVEGLGPALSEAFSWALERGYEKIVNLDGDLSHNPKDIPLLLSMAEKSDLVIGSRYVDGIRVLNWPPRRLALSLGAAAFVRAITGMPIRDPTSGFRCFRREALHLALSEPPISTGYSIHIELLHRIWSAQMRVYEVPILFTDRVDGSTKMNSGIIAEALWVTLRLLIANGLRRSPLRGRFLGAEPAVRTGV